MLSIWTKIRVFELIHKIYEQDNTAVQRPRRWRLSHSDIYLITPREQRNANAISLWWIIIPLCIKRPRSIDALHGDLSQGAPHEGAAPWIAMVDRFRHCRDNKFVSWNKTSLIHTWLQLRRAGWKRRCILAALRTSANQSICNDDMVCIS